MSRTTVFTGCGTAIVTPFNADFSINYDALERFVDYQIANGVKAIVACGTTGEAATLNDDEQISVIQCVVDRAKPQGATVIAGAGSNDTRHGVELSKRAAATGAAWAASRRSSSAARPTSSARCAARASISPPCR